MNSIGMQAELSNWSKSARSKCVVYPVTDVDGIAGALAAARAQRLSVIAHGAGHSYTDAALNTGGMVIDVTPLHRILAWDAGQGVMRVEPGVTLRQMVQAAWKDGWWPAVSPSTPEVTAGGCAAMNVNGRNAWKCGPFGATIISLDVLFPTGETRTLAPGSEPRLFQAFVGSMGLLGFITSITVQLQRITSGYVTLRRRSAASLDEIFALFAEEEGRSDFMEAWLDGFAGGGQLGRGNLTSAVLAASGEAAPIPFPKPGLFSRLETPLVRLAVSLGRPLLQPGVQLANRANYYLGRLDFATAVKQVALVPYTYWPPVAFAGYHAMFTEGVETFQAFLPAECAPEVFKQALRYSQTQAIMPLWCIIKRHRSDPFLLSYQVDGFSLELNYQRTAQNAPALKRTLETMIAAVVEAGGKFYLAKDHFLTHAQYRRSMGDEAVDAFLNLKQRFDPETRLQSDLFRRVFMPPQL